MNSAMHSPLREFSANVNPALPESSTRIEASHGAFSGSETRARTRPTSEGDPVLNCAEAVPRRSNNVTKRLVITFSESPLRMQLNINNDADCRPATLRQETSQLRKR